MKQRNLGLEKLCLSHGVLLDLHHDLLRKIFDGNILVGMCVCRRFHDELAKCPISLKFRIKAEAKRKSENRIKINFCQKFRFLKAFLVVNCSDDWNATLRGSSAAKFLQPWFLEIPHVASLDLSGVSLDVGGAKWLAEWCLPTLSVLTNIDLASTR